MTTLQDLNRQADLQNRLFHFVRTGEFAKPISAGTGTQPDPNNNVKVKVVQRMPC